MKQVTLVTATLVEHRGDLSAQDVAQACGMDLAWLQRLGQAGVLDATALCGDDLRRVRQIVRIQRAFDVNPEAAALINDLSEEVKRLKRHLRALGESL